MEIVDLPSYKIVIFHSYVKLPEGKPREPIYDLRRRGWDPFIHWRQILGGKSTTCQPPQVL